MVILMGGLYLQGYAMFVTASDRQSVPRFAALRRPTHEHRSVDA
jgi:hypothetical protein